MVSCCAESQLILITIFAAGYVMHSINLGRIALAGKSNCIFFFQISSAYLQPMQDSQGQLWESTETLTVEKVLS